MLLYHMLKEEFKIIRKNLGKNQKELSKILNISVKTVESYEQGLRHIPLNIKRILYYIYFKTKISNTKNEVKCWEDKSCPEEVKKNCLAWITSEGFYCWFFTGRSCIREIQLSRNKTRSCFDCNFFIKQRNNFK